MARIFNFSEGPAILPVPVLERAREELRGWRSTGVSVMELSYRGEDFIGVAEKAEAVRKAAKLYAAIDAAPLYSNPVEPAVRSRMNVPFHLADAALEALFLADAKGGGARLSRRAPVRRGLRASIHNAMPEEGVEALISFMREFERKRG
jgi:phosphoserine aminotransferase